MLGLQMFTYDGCNYGTFFLIAQQPLVDQSLLIIEASR
jgi:hypothetical protein